MFFEEATGMTPKVISSGHFSCDIAGETKDDSIIAVSMHTPVNFFI
jgi:hypothetical protein